MPESRLAPQEFDSARWRRFSIGSIGIALGLLGAAILASYSGLRTTLRDQLANRDAQIFATILERQIAASSSKSGDWLLAIVETSAEASSSLQVESLALFDTEGNYFASIAGTNNTAAIDSKLRSELEQQSEVWQYVGGARPALFVTTVLREDAALAKPLAYARFTLDGSEIAREFSRLDASLAGKALGTFAAAGAAMTGMLMWAFSRLRKTSLQLAKHSAGLREANQKLLLAAKTSAVGALTSHLVHGLKNPLGALQHFVVSLSQSETQSSEIADAAAAAKRMKGMIDDVMRVLREEAAIASYTIPATDLLQTLEKRMTPLVKDFQTTTPIFAEADAELGHREANVSLLILENLATNAVQASGPGKPVKIHATRSPDATEIEFTVSDEGPGLPPEIASNLFAPVHSTKPGGSGLGLAISHQLALHVGGRLTLVRSDRNGSQFSLWVPLAPRKANQNAQAPCPR